MRSRRSQLGLVLSGAIVTAAGFGVAVVEVFHFPHGSVWAVVGAAALVVGVIRVFTAPRGEGR